MALLTLVGGPAIVVYWILVHSLAPRWRRVGVPVALAAILSIVVAAAVALAGREEILLGADLGLRPPLVVLAVGMFALGAWLGAARGKQLRFTTLVGLDELAPERFGSRLLTEGIYARTRNPRYLELGCALAGSALFANYVGVWVLVTLSIPAAYVVVLLEERELRDRFGAEYERYCASVPRFIPRGRAGPGSPDPAP